LIEGCELYQRIASKQDISEDEGRKYFRQIVMALRHVHQQGIAHRDMKPENILIDKQGNVKIIDFGLAAYHCTAGPESSPITMTEKCGTKALIAPEVLRGNGYNGAIADIWSLGVILFSMFTRAYPFRGATDSVVVTKIKAGMYSMSNSIPVDAQDLIRKLLVVDPAQRITLDAVLAHPWLHEHFPTLSSGFSASFTSSIPESSLAHTETSSVAELSADETPHSVPRVLPRRAQVSPCPTVDFSWLSGIRNALVPQPAMHPQPKECCIVPVSHERTTEPNPVRMFDQQNFGCPPNAGIEFRDQLGHSYWGFLNAPMKDGVVFPQSAYAPSMPPMMLPSGVPLQSIATPLF